MPSILTRSSLLRFTLLLAAAVVLRCDTFGDPNLHGDEVFYRTVGVAMQHGVLPYVDVWDRKPFGLFALYYLIAGISAAPLAYQFTATLFAAGTAAAIGAIARRWSNAKGALLAGLCYLLWLAPLQGFGGQSPVFYNFFIAIAALLVQQSLPALEQGHAPGRAAMAMLLAGIGLTIKTTALFESGFLGLYAAWTLHHSPAPRGKVVANVLMWLALGAGPSLLIAAFYLADGHWMEFWHAMVVSNIAKQPDRQSSMLRLGILLGFLTPLLALAALGLRKMPEDGRRFVLLWLAAAAIGLCAVPNFYIHYGMPLTVPLCVGAAGFLARQAGMLWTALIATLSFILATPFQFTHTRQSRAAMAALAQTVRAHVGRSGLLTYDGPPQLYELTGKPFLTPLVFPTHLSHDFEKDVSHLSTLGEMRRVLALRPGAVVMAEPIRNGPVNEETRQLVLGYVGKHCRLVKALPVLERLRTDIMIVWGDCR
jgi:MFS family permease